MSPHAEDVLAHAIRVSQQHQHMTKAHPSTSISSSSSSSSSSSPTPSLTLAPVEFHKPMRLTAICEEEDEDATTLISSPCEVPLEQVSVTTPMFDEPMKPLIPSTTPAWSITRVWTSSAIPLPILSWPSWLFLSGLMLIQTCVTVWGYSVGQPQYALYLPYHLLPSIILLRWWLDTGSTPSSPMLVSMAALSPYDSLFRAYAMGFTVVAGCAIAFQSAFGHMLLNAFVNHMPAEYHDYYAMWVVAVSCIMCVGEEGIKYVVASRVLTATRATGNKLPIMTLTVGTLGCVTACSLYFTVSDMYMSTPTSQLMSFHYSLLAMLPVHCCTATLIGLAIAYRRLVPESWVSATHVLVVPIALRLVITCMYFSYVMLFHNIHSMMVMIFQMTLIAVVVFQIPYAAYQRYCANPIKHVY